MLRADRPPVSRVREIRMHGLKGGVGSETWPCGHQLGTNVYQ
jgi:hypothetical protein